MLYQVTCTPQIHPNAPLNTPLNTPRIYPHIPLLYTPYTPPINPIKPITQVPEGGEDEGGPGGEATQEGEGHVVEAEAGEHKGGDSGTVAAPPRAGHLPTSRRERGHVGGTLNTFKKSCC